MMEKTCFFMGHRDAPESIYTLIIAEAERHIAEYGVTAFIVGHYGAFDRMAARAVSELKKEHANIHLTLLLPYHPAVRTVCTCAPFDSTLYPSGMENVPPRYAISRANRKIIDQVGYLICYSRLPCSSTHKLMLHAAGRERNGLLRVTNIAPSADFI